MPASRIVAAWEAIEAALHAQFPAVLATLAPPAQAAEIDAVEQICEVALPLDLRESLLRHNGQRDSHRTRGLVNGADLLDAETIGRMWQMWAMVTGDGNNEVHPSNDISDAIATRADKNSAPLAAAGATLQSGCRTNKASRIVIQTARPRVGTIFSSPGA